MAQHGTTSKLDKTKENLFSEESPVKESDYKVIKKFIKRCHMENLGQHRIRKYLFQFKKLAEYFDYEFKDADREDIEDLIIEIKKCDDWMDSTKRAYRIGVRKFYTTLSDEHNGQGDYPDKVAWIDTTRKKSNSKLPEEILSKDDINELAEATWNKRDEAFILALYESGCRIGEILPIQRKDIEFDNKGARLTVSGKTGSRRIRLYLSVPALKSWMEVHPESEEPDSYIWVNRLTQSNPVFNNEPLHDKTIRRRLRKVANKTEVEKPVNPHAFRHARATHLASELTGAQMREYFGWSRNSSVPSKYIHLSGRDIDDAILELHGEEPEKMDEENALNNHTCPECDGNVSPASTYCSHCDACLDESREREEFEDLMIKFMKEISEEDPEIKQKFQEIVKEEQAGNLF